MRRYTRGGSWDFSMLRCGVFLLVCPAFAASAWAEFPQGVASGDVLSDRAICWTRVTAAGDIRIDLAITETFEPIVETGVVAATEATGLAIKYEAAPLDAATRYFYRFTRLDNGETSPIGTFFTAPIEGAGQLFRFVYTGDAGAGRQPFRLLEFAAQEKPEFWFFAGDTIYADQAAGGLGNANDLASYRAKYAQNRGDAALQRLSAASPVWVQWDDHEVANDYDGADPEPGIPREQISDAYQAFFENQPIRDAGVSGDPRRTYRSFRYGSLAEFFLLDCRQYRSRDAGREGGDVDPYGYILPTRNPAVIDRLNDPSRTMLGAAQLEWLKNGLAASSARWKFILSSVTFTSLLVMPYDRWDGYEGERRDLLRFIDESRIEGVVILSADIHGSTYNPDVTYYLRNSLGQSYSSGFRIPEFVAGPIAQATIRQELDDVAAGIFNLPVWALNCSIPYILLVDFAQNQVRDRNRLAFIEPRQYVYLSAEVGPQGLRLTYQGIPADSSDRTTPATVLHSVTLPEPPLCGVMPVPVLVGAATLCLVDRRGKRGTGKY